MADYDLDINNYNLEDILQLFKLPYAFSEKDLKAAYRKALGFHPDKSNLPSDYFLFFMKAYKTLASIFYFRQRKKESAHEVEYQAEEMNEGQKEILKRIDSTKFNQWFNKMFEKVKIQDEQHDTGYEDWLRSNKDIFDVSAIPKNEIDAEFQKRKSECRAMVINKQIMDFSTHTGGGYDLLREKPQEYSSEIFSKLPYEDLKKAHIETVVPVTKEDYEKVKKFTDVQSYKRYRERNEPNAPSLEQSKQLLAKKKREMVKSEAERAYSIMKQDEVISEKNKKWWGYVRQLTNE